MILIYVFSYLSIFHHISLARQPHLMSLARELFTWIYFIQYVSSNLGIKHNFFSHYPQPTSTFEWRDISGGQKSRAIRWELKKFSNLAILSSEKMISESCVTAGMLFTNLEYGGNFFLAKSHEDSLWLCANFFVALFSLMHTYLRLLQLGHLCEKLKLHKTIEGPKLFLVKFWYRVKNLSNEKSIFFFIT